MKRKIGKSVIIVFSLVFALFLSGCQNPFLVNATKLYNASFVTDCDTKIDSYRTSKIESIQELIKEDYVFDGWYTDAAFEGETVTFPYELTEDTTFYAKWILKYNISFETNCDTKIDSYKTAKIESIQKLTKEGYVFGGWYTNADFEGEQITFPYELTEDTIFYAKWLETVIFDSEKIKNSADYVNGVLTLKSDYGTVVFDGDSSKVFTNLCIKVSNPNTKLILDNFSFSSSEATSLIESAFDISIEYKGTNKLSSTSSSVNSLIKTLGTIEFNGNENSSLELLPNATTTSTDCAIVKAGKVIINGGNVVIKESNGEDGTADGSHGVNGSTGIMAAVEIKNNAVVAITGGNGGNGAPGTTGNLGSTGSQSNRIGYDGGPGGNGGNGGNGGVGGNGGNAIYGNVEVESAKVVLSSGNGGEGGNGGTGGKGGKGGRCTAWRSTAGTGGRGGSGGNGGDGGDGGNAVKGNFVVKSGEITLLGADGGNGGSGGNGGNGGNGGDYNICPDAHAGSGGVGGSRGYGGDGGSKGYAVTGSFNKQDSSVSSSSGEVGSNGGIGNYGEKGSDGIGI